MAVIERQITINAPPERVFAYLSDISRHAEWAGHSLKVEKTSEGPVAVGSTFSTVGHQLGRDFEAEVRITELVSNEKLAFEAEGKDFHFSHHFLLRSENGGTRLTKGGEAKRLGFPFGLLLPLLSALGVVARGLDGDLQRIKARLEAGGAEAVVAPEPAPAEPSPEPPAALPSAESEAAEADEPPSAEAL